MQAVLVMFRSDGERRSFSVTRNITVIGRREDSDLRIPLGDVSRKHCRLIKDGDGMRLEDLGSSNGTYHNGVRVEKDAVLQPGDSIQVGPVVFVLQVDGVPADEDLHPITTAAAVPHPEAQGTVDLSGVSAAPPPLPAALAGGAGVGPDEGLEPLEALEPLDAEPVEALPEGEPLGAEPLAEAGAVEPLEELDAIPLDDGGDGGHALPTTAAGRATPAGHGANGGHAGGEELEELDALPLADDDAGHGAAPHAAAAAGQGGAAHDDDQVIALDDHAGFDIVDESQQSSGGDLHLDHIDLETDDPHHQEQPRQGK
jgi:predicted component of type VI protein secretion system